MSSTYSLAATRYCGSASVHTTGGCIGVLQPQDEAESRDFRQRPEEASQRADDERGQATGALRSDRRGARQRQAAPAVQVRQQRDFRRARRAGGQVATASEATGSMLSRVPEYAEK